MRQYFLAAIALLPMAAHAEYADLSKSQCLQYPMTVSELDLPLRRPAGENQTWDARNKTFLGNQDMAGVVHLERGNNTCVLGATLRGTIPEDAPWNSGQKPDGIQFSRSEGPITIDGMVIEGGVNDGISPPKAANTSRSVEFTIRDASVRARDDGIENDACLGGVIEDSLIFSHMGIAVRPGTGQTVDLGPDMPVITIRDSVFSLICQTDHRGGNTCPDGTSHAEWFKLSEQCRASDGRIGPHWVLDNVIFHAEHASRNGVGFMIFPPPGRVRATNVTVLYGGPGELPPMPPGVAVIRDRGVIDAILEMRLQRWYAEHGCDAEGNNCAFLHFTRWPPTGVQ